MSVTEGGSAVKFVNIFPRCCCGAKGTSKCHNSLHAFTIHTWTMRMDGGGDGTAAGWVMDGVMDSTELWALEAFQGLPRVQLLSPIVSLDNPHIICFMICARYFVKGCDDNTQWLIMLDMRSKNLLSTHHDLTGCAWSCLGKSLVPSRVSDYFNPAYPTSHDSSGSLSVIRSHTDIASPVNDESRGNNGTSSSAQSSSEKSSANAAIQVSRVLAVFQEIPSYGLAQDDTLKTYSILSHDNYRRFKALLELPVGLRKDWLLMEIKATEA